PCVASSTCSLLRVVKNTFAWEKSGETSTPVNVIMPTRGSRKSRCTSSESSRWIKSPSFCGRPEVLWRFNLETGTDHVFSGAAAAKTWSVPDLGLKAPGDFEHFEHLELVAFLDIGEILERHAAFEARLHLAHVVLEALEGIDLAGVDHHVIAQHADLCTALDHTFLHVAARHRADLGDAEHLAHLHEAEHRFLLLRREHSRER